MDASRLARPALMWWKNRTRLQFCIRPLVQVWYLLALMEFADPRLISRKGSRPKTLIRLGGSRSDLSAITSHVPCATFPRPSFV